MHGGSHISASKLSAGGALPLTSGTLGPRSHRPHTNRREQGCPFVVTMKPELDLHSPDSAHCATEVHWSGKGAFGCPVYATDPADGNVAAKKVQLAQAVATLHSPLVADRSLHPEHGDLQLAHPCSSGSGRERTLCRLLHAAMMLSPQIKQICITWLQWLSRSAQPSGGGGHVNDVLHLRRLLADHCAPRHAHPADIKQFCGVTQLMSCHLLAAHG